MVLKAVLAASLLSTAQAWSLFERQVDINQNGCAGIIGDYYGTLYCCPGLAYNDTDEYPRGSGFCCVGARFPIPASRFGGPSSFGRQTSAALPTASEVNILPITDSQSCRTTIMFTDSEYTSKANANGASITGPLSLNTESAVFTRPVEPTTAADPTTRSGATTGGASNTGSGSMTMTGTGTSSVSSATTGFSGGVISGVSSNPGAATSRPSTALGARVTSGPMAGAIMVAGGLLAAAL